MRLCYESNLWKSLKKKGILLKETTEKVINQKVGLLVPLIRAGLLLMTNVLTPRVENVLLPLGVTVSSPTNRCSYSKDNFWIGDDCTDNPKRRNGWHYGNN